METSQNLDKGTLEVAAVIYLIKRFGFSQTHEEAVKGIPDEAHPFALEILAANRKICSPGFIPLPHGEDHVQDLACFTDHHIALAQAGKLERVEFAPEGKAAWFNQRN